MCSTLRVNTWWLRQRGMTEPGGEQHERPESLKWLGFDSKASDVSDIFRTRGDRFSYSQSIAVCGKQVTLLKSVRLEPDATTQNSHRR